MKKCGYCGSENAGDLKACQDCGTDLEIVNHQPVSKANLYLSLALECLGYLVAIPAAGFISVLALQISSMITYNLLIESFLAGFFGILIGAFFFPRSNRRFRNRVFGSVLLLATGLAFEILNCETISSPSDIITPYYILIILATVIGGLVACALHYWFQPRKTTNSLSPILPESSPADHSGVA